jgi:hypothetical protein
METRFLLRRFTSLWAGFSGFTDSITGWAGILTTAAGAAPGQPPYQSDNIHAKNIVSASMDRTKMTGFMVFILFSKSLPPQDRKRPAPKPLVAAERVRHVYAHRAVA